ncbi:MAG: FAD-dependent oxidoreductase [Sandaracinaceae bacterium]|nr:FAD-dependent oxidoreductase [Sandaracinaceae bacterium]
MERVRHLIVGAGISGLAYADRLARGPHGRTDDVLVVEADIEIGGYCKTIVREVEGPAGPARFVWDYSGHFFHFKHKDIETDLVGRMKGQRVLSVDKDSRIHWPGGKRPPSGRGEISESPTNWVEFPFQKNIHHLPQADFVDCLYELYLREERWASFAGGASKGQRATSFLEMLYQRFGRGITERFLRPYNEKLYATDLGTLDVDAMGRFFPHADITDIVRNMREANNATYNASFTYPEGGAIQYVHALASSLAERSLSLGERVISIDLANKVATTTKRTIAFEHLVSSMPFVKLLDAAGLAYTPSTYTWNQVLVFNLGFDRKGPEGVHWAYYPQKELSFYRVGFYDNIFGAPNLSLYVELGYPRGAVIDEAEITRARARVLADLEKVGVTSGHHVIAEHHVVMDPAYVHITRASLADVADKKRVLESRGVSSIGRYGSWTYCSIEDNIVEARALADQHALAWSARR